MFRCERMVDLWEDGQESISCGFVDSHVQGELNFQGFFSLFLVTLASELSRFVGTMRLAIATAKENSFDKSRSLYNARSMLHKSEYNNFGEE